MEDAQDATQEVFIRLHRKIRQIDSSRGVSPWLYAVTVNACHDIARTRQRSRLVAMPEGTVEAPSAGSDPEGLYADRQREEQLRAILHRLPEKERAALLLREMEGLTTEEVARILGSTVGTVRSQVCTARLERCANYWDGNGERHELRTVRRAHRALYRGRSPARRGLAVGRAPARLRGVLGAGERIGIRPAVAGQPAAGSGRRGLRCHAASYTARKSRARRWNWKWLPAMAAAAAPLLAAGLRTLHRPAPHRSLTVAARMATPVAVPAVTTKKAAPRKPHPAAPDLTLEEAIAMFQQLEPPPPPPGSDSPVEMHLSTSDPNVTIIILEPSNGDSR